MSILIIDNYDSFVFNLARHFERLGQATRVVRNTSIDLAAIQRQLPDAIVLSPGPGAPQQAGQSLELVRLLHNRVPMLGVCLGHQTIAEALGGRIVSAGEPMHGRASPIFHDGRDVFAGLPCPFPAARYHSLAVEESTLPATLEVAARSADGTIMALRHRQYAVVGLQFHPESILTAVGYRVLAGFLRLAHLPEPPELQYFCDELAS
jgi:anthranilate synthase/aminodeoxychorismate synthase-like glutamine amidotransferase